MVIEARLDTGGGTGVLALCTANVCRSPMAAALLARRLAGLGVGMPVCSAGMLHDGAQPPAEVIAAIAAYGLDVTDHRSHVVSGADLAAAGLVLAMAREHVRHAVVTKPEVWPRTFTLRELLRRGEQIGARPVGESLAEWLWRAHEGRVRAELLGHSPDDDVADPIGGPPHAYAATAALLDQLVTRLAELCWGHADAEARGR